MSVKSNILSSDISLRSNVGNNSYSADTADFVKYDDGAINKVGAGEEIIGYSQQPVVFASDNESVDKVNLLYAPIRENMDWIINSGIQLLTFSADLIADNTINLKINGVVMTEITYATSHAATMAAIATQLETDFSTVIASADVDGSDDKIINIKLVGEQVNVVATEIVVAAGLTQATGVYTSPEVELTDLGSYYDLLASSQNIDLTSKSATEGQVRLVGFKDRVIGVYEVANK